MTVIDQIKDFASQPQNRDALIGAGIGAGGGALTSAFMNGDTSHLLRDLLIGAGIGGTAGYLGGGKIREQVAKLRGPGKLPGPTAAPVAKAPPKRMGLGAAAASGIGPAGGVSALHGYSQGGKGQAAWSGGSSLLGQLLGGTAGYVAGGKNKKLGALLGGLLGGVAGSTAAAHGFNRSEAARSGLTEKTAASRRDFLSLMLRNTLAGSAAGTAYKAGFRPLTKNLSHEVASPDVIRGANAGPFSKPGVGDVDLASWEAARKRTSDHLLSGVDWGGNPPGQQIADAMNRAGYSALSGPGAAAAKKRFVTREATKGAVGGGALAGVATYLRTLLRDAKALTKQSSAVTSYC